MRAQVPFFALTLALASFAVAPPSSAEESSSSEGPQPQAIPTEPGERCVFFHMAAQRQRRDKQLLEAKASLRECAVAACPAMVQQDCVQWIQSIDEQTPSVVFSIESNGQSLTDARVTIDGVDVDASQGTAVPLNPGQHHYEVVRPPYQTQSGTLTILEGQRFRIINVQLANAPVAPSAPPPAPVMEKVRPVPTAAWVLGGIGIAGLGAFAGMALVGRGQENDLEQVCAPDCTDHDLSSMRALYLGADIAAGVGAAALIAGAVVYVTRPTEERPVSFRIGVQPLVGGAQTTLRWSAF